jgi:hypothetical protein
MFRRNASLAKSSAMGSVATVPICGLAAGRAIPVGRVSTEYPIASKPRWPQVLSAIMVVLSGSSSPLRQLFRGSRVGEGLPRNREHAAPRSSLATCRIEIGFAARRGDWRLRPRRFCRRHPGDRTACDWTRADSIAADRRVDCAQARHCRTVDRAAGDTRVIAASPNKTPAYGGALQA